MRKIFLSLRTGSITKLNFSDNPLRKSLTIKAGSNTEPMFIVPPTDVGAPTTFNQDEFIPGIILNVSKASLFIFFPFIVIVSPALTFTNVGGIDTIPEVLLPKFTTILLTGLPFTLIENANALDGPPTAPDAVT